MELLDAAHGQVNAFEGLSFNLGNLITLGGLLIGGIRIWMKITSNQQDSDNRIKGLEDSRIKSDEDHDAEIQAASHGRIAIKKELRFEMAKEHDVITKRIDKTQSDVKEHKKDSDSEFKILTGLMNTVNGKLDILIQNNSK